MIEITLQPNYFASNLTLDIFLDDFEGNAIEIDPIKNNIATKKTIYSIFSIT